MYIKTDFPSLDPFQMLPIELNQKIIASLENKSDHYQCFQVSKLWREVACGLLHITSLAETKKELLHHVSLFADEIKDGTRNSEFYCIFSLYLGHSISIKVSKFSAKDTELGSIYSFSKGCLFSSKWPQENGQTISKIEKRIGFGNWAFPSNIITSNTCDIEFICKDTEENRKFVDEIEQIFVERKIGERE